MADTIKIYSFDVDTIKIGSANVDAVYVGASKVYPTEEPTPSYPYAFYRESRGGSAYTIACNASSAQTVTSANTRSGLSNAQISGSSAAQTPTKVVFGDCCTSIGGKACSGWTYLTSITISNSVTSITDNGGSFQNCYRVEELKIGSGITSLKGNIFSNIGASASTSPNLDLSKNNGLVISGNTFYASHLNEVKLPKNLTLYGTNEFYVSKIASLKFGENTIIKNGTSTASPFYLSKIDSIDLSGVVEIGNYAFHKASGFTTVTIPNTVTYLGTNIFSNCSTLTSVTLNYTSAITFGGNGMFNNCTSLQEINIGDSVTKLGTAEGTGSFFYGCTSLTNITIPSGVTTIGGSMFQNCSNLSRVTVEATVPPTLGANAFDNTSSDLKIFVPAASVSAYKSSKNWSDYASNIVSIM